MDTVAIEIQLFIGIRIRVELSGLLAEVYFGHPIESPVPLGLDELAVKLPLLGDIFHFLQGNFHPLELHTIVFVLSEVTGEPPLDLGEVPDHLHLDLLELLRAFNPQIVQEVVIQDPLSLPKLLTPIILRVELQLPQVERKDGDLGVS